MGFSKINILRCVLQEITTSVVIGASVVQMPICNYFLRRFFKGRAGAKGGLLFATVLLHLDNYV